VSRRHASDAARASVDPGAATGGPCDTTPGAVDPQAAASSLDGSAWDAVVVGAGPAGSLAAHELSRRGRRVLLVERHVLPRDKVCGGCLHPRGVDLLDQLGLSSVLVASEAVTLQTLQLTCAGKSLTLSPALGVAVSRSTFDLHLARAAGSAGATRLEGWIARLAPADDDGPRRVSLSHPDGATATVDTDLVVAADGLASPVFGAEVASDTARRASHLGAGALLPPDAVPEHELPPGQVCLALGTSGYVGRVRLPDGRVDLAAALSPEATRAGAARAGAARAGAARAGAARAEATRAGAARAGVGRAGVGRAAAALLRAGHAPACAEAAQSASWRTTAALTREPRRLAGRRVLAVGDAAGFVEPFTGEGMTWALEGGALLGELAADGWHDDLGARWDQALRTRLAASRRRCARVSALLRRPRLLGSTLSLLARAPRLASRVVSAGHGTTRA
jgi:flavin-dependent dehydrogenase